MRQVGSNFWDNVDRSGGPDACWPWKGARFGGAYQPKGSRSRQRRQPYGKFTYVKEDGVSVTVAAHRYAWEEENGPVPPGKILRHVACRNPPCVNPRHVAPGTHQDNSNDAVRDGTPRFGLGHPRAKLSIAKITCAATQRAAGRLLKDVALELGVHREVLSRALRGKSWRRAREQSELIRRIASRMTGKPSGVVTRLADFGV